MIFFGLFNYLVHVISNYPFGTPHHVVTNIPQLGMHINYAIEGIYSAYVNCDSV